MHRRSITRDERSPVQYAYNKQRHHDRRIIGGPTMSIGPVGPAKRGQVNLIDHVDEEPHKVIRR
jgi:hypothetical protein